ncbi:AAA family ATPase [Clostridium algidicarnis]|uniref:AAA family ATPase n=1 Tax=Clostridium algidicarnis TaxID=37659 RepID=UPI001C0B41D3|nr:AAA family ATPase [Clostridium algidicarnis]MBU3202753.1 AAA family ATPase [Clostridium algidicarnis]MBU3210907.1 AAA family ATPase [Clostridium algidicarnis]MBU3222585.1 AAA family ATPase [Clostridium algidicarnis]
MINIYYGPTDEYKEFIDIKVNENILSLNNILEIMKENKNEELESKYDKLVIYENEYSFLSEAGQNMILYILKISFKKYHIKEVYMQNPTKQIKSLIINNIDVNHINIKTYEYKKVENDVLIEITEKFNDKILFQESVKENLEIVLYHILKRRNKGKPIVLMFFGESGVGETETAKYIGSLLGGNIMRVQMSMFQSSTYLDYLSGSEHNNKSFSRDLLNRKTNIVLLDEFDKTNYSIVSLFYQAFDEGIFSDLNYDVNLNDLVFICTTNFLSEKEIRSSLGDPMFYRFDELIKFEKIEKQEIDSLISTIVKRQIEYLDDSEKIVLKESEFDDNISKLTYILIKNFENITINFRVITKMIVREIEKILVKEYLAKL